MRIFVIGFALLALCNKPATGSLPEYNDFTRMYMKSYRYSRVANARVKKIPDINANHFDLLNEGQVIYLTGKTSNKKFKATIRGKEYFAPYVQIDPGNNKKGWVYEPSLKRINVIEVRSLDESSVVYNSLSDYLNHNDILISSTKKSSRCEDPLGNCPQKSDIIKKIYKTGVSMEIHDMYESHAVYARFPDQSIENIYNIVVSSHRPLYGLKFPEVSSIIDVNYDKSIWSGFISMEKSYGNLFKIRISGTTDGDYYDIVIEQKGKDVFFSFRNGI